MTSCTTSIVIGTDGSLDPNKSLRLQEGYRFFKDYDCQSSHRVHHKTLSHDGAQDV
jgi:hypothetical protein